VAYAVVRGGLSLNEIARMMGLTRQRVSTIEARALRKLRALGDVSLADALEALREREGRRCDGDGTLCAESDL
jgi:DNA-binding CsgD family transcriptional regulator